MATNENNNTSDNTTTPYEDEIKLANQLVSDGFPEELADDFAFAALNGMLF